MATTAAMPTSAATALPAAATANTTSTVDEDHHDTIDHNINNILSVRSSTSDDDGLDAAEVSSDSNVDLLEETERLLAKLATTGQNVSTTLVASSGTDNSLLLLDPQRSVATSTEYTGTQDRTSDDNDDDDDNLDEMLLKAGNLSSMMLMSTSEGRSTTSRNRRDPDGNSLRSLTRVVTSPVDSSPTNDPAGTTVSRDPPGSSSGDDAFDAGHPTNLRPTSSVHLRPSHEMDDDVSSVGSQSFRPSLQSFLNASTTPGGGVTNGSNLRNNHSIPKEPHTTLVSPLLPTTPPSITTAHDDLEWKVDVPSSPPHPVGLPPTDLTADFDIVSQTRRNDTDTDTDAPPSVQWEKVDTAHEGEDDYVPLVDYTRLGRSTQTNTHKNNTTASGNRSPGSRVAALRKRHHARRNRRTRILWGVGVATGVAVVAVVVYQPPFVSWFPATTVQDNKVPVVLEPPPQTLVTGSDDDGYTLVGNDPSVIVTLPRVLPVVEEAPTPPPKRKRRFLWGLFRRRQKDS